MERDTAQHVVDVYLDVPLNAPAIVWVATANDPSLIPGHILSRMAVYEFPRRLTTKHGTSLSVV